MTVEFKKGLNVLIGENDSGKTAIVDAIRYILNTESYEQIRFDEKDFHKSGNEREKSFEIEAIISGLEPKEAGNFLEWAYFNDKKEYELRVCLKANLQINNRITYDIKAGPEGVENQMDGNARDLLKVTYLKPLRDAENELTPGYRSRLAQILLSHKYFKKEKDAEGRLKSHPFEVIINEANDKIKDTQIILTTHSTTLGSSIKLDYLILCKGNDVYPMWKGKTILENGDYNFLERFLDATKANLFFARGVILVEGDAENILIPTIAEIIGKPLHKFGVSVVNVGSTAFLSYAKIFMRNDGKKLKIPVAVITDLDVKAMEYYNDTDHKTKVPEVYVIDEKFISAKETKYDISDLKGNIYENVTDLKNDIQVLLNKKSLPTDLLDGNQKISKRIIDNALIEKLRVLKKKD